MLYQHQQQYFKQAKLQPIASGPNGSGALQTISNQMSPMLSHQPI